MNQYKRFCLLSFDSYLSLIQGLINSFKFLFKVWKDSQFYDFERKDVNEGSYVRKDWLSIDYIQFKIVLWYNLVLEKFFAVQFFQKVKFFLKTNSPPSWVVELHHLFSTSRWSYLLYVSMWSFVPYKYLRTFFAAFQCCIPRLLWYLPKILAAKLMSSRVQI